MKKGTKYTLSVIFGIFIAFPIFSMTYYTMVRTSTPQFCSTCHEIRPAFMAWKTSTHVNNAQGIVADCMDCHLPAPHDTIDFFYSKTMHGLKDVVSHFTGGDERYDRAVMRQRIYDTLENSQCMKCHRNILNLPGKRGGHAGPSAGDLSASRIRIPLHGLPRQFGPRGPGILQLQAICPAIHGDGTSGPIIKEDVS